MNKSNFDNTIKRDWVVYSIEIPNLREDVDLKKTEEHPKVNVKALIEHLNMFEEMGFRKCGNKYWGIAANFENRMDQHLKGKDDIGLFSCLKKGHEPKIEKKAILLDMTYPEATKWEEWFAWDDNLKAKEELKFGEVTFINGPYFKVSPGRCQREYTYPDNPEDLLPRCMRDAYGKTYFRELKPFLAAQRAIVEDLN